MPSCILKTCCNRTFRKSKKQEDMEKKQKITFHTFPKQEDKRKEWCKILELSEDSLKSKSVICSIHFNKDSFDKSSRSYIRLKPNANPYLLLKASLMEKKSTAQSPADTPTEQNTDVCNVEMVACNTINRETGSSDVIEPAQSSPKVSRAISVSPWKIYNSPSKKQLREELRRTKEKYKLQVKTLTQKTRRMKKRIASMKTILKAIEQKNVLKGDQLNNLKGIF